MTLRQSLDHSAAAGGSAPRFAARPPRLPSVAARLVEFHGRYDRKRLSIAERAALLQRLRRLRFDWQRVDGVDRLSVAYVLWDGPDPPAERPDFLIDFLHWLETPFRRVQASRLAVGWAVAFDPDADSTRIVGEWLDAHAAALLRPWVDLSARFEIFALDRGPAALAESFLAAAQGEAEFFVAHGLGGLGIDPAVTVGGLALEVLGAAAEIVRAKLETEPRLALRLIDLSTRGARFRPDAAAPTARTQTIRGRIAEALLLPWRDVKPPADVKAAIVDHLLRHYGDLHAAERWRGIDPSAMAIFRDWTKERTIEAFFGLLGRRRDIDVRQLHARRDFWASCIGRVDDAWLIAGTQGIDALAPSGLRCGRLVGCAPDDCALLLQIGGTVILDTGRGGDHLLWRAGNRLAPPFARRPDYAYSAVGLAAGADFVFAGRRRDGGASPQALREFIALHTGGAVL